MWISRTAESLIITFAERFPVVIVTGARQTGKTSLLTHLYPKMNYLSLDDPAEAANAESVPEKFLSGLSIPAIIDEVQYAPSLFRQIKRVVDTGKNPGQFFLTGSQTFSLMQNVSESLAGRAGIIHLQTLSANEIHSSLPDLTLDELISRGGFPALYAGTHTVSSWFPSYLMTYLERDVRNLLKVANIRDYGRFIRAVAVRTAQTFSLSDIARDIGISPNTVRSWISVLQASGIVSLLEPYATNLTKRLVKTPKIYFNDTGLAIHLLGMKDWEDIKNSPFLGAIWETHVYNQLLKYFSNKGESSPSLWYWRTKDGHEVDFIIERGRRFVLIESKAGEKPDVRDLRGVKAFTAEYGEKSVIKTVVACMTKKDYTSDGILFSDMTNVSELGLDG